jgi:hypothetical protein
LSAQRRKRVSQGEKASLAPCGIDCAACDLYRAAFDTEAAGRMAAWFRSRGWLPADAGVEALRARMPLCDGCLGDRAACWTPDCELRACCVDERELTSCHRCDAFVCEKLTAWVGDYAPHAEVVERLRAMRDADLPQASDASRP